MKGFMLGMSVGLITALAMETSRPKKKAKPLKDKLINILSD